MATFFLFGKYAPGSIKDISPERTKKASDLVKDLGGKIKDGYALLGDTDLVLIADFPKIEQAMKASVELSKMLGISFSTAPAISVDEFDKLMK